MVVVVVVFVVVVSVVVTDDAQYVPFPRNKCRKKKIKDEVEEYVLLKMSEAGGEQIARE